MNDILHTIGLMKVFNYTSSSFSINAGSRLLYRYPLSQLSLDFLPRRLAFSAAFSIATES